MNLIFVLTALATASTGSATRPLSLEAPSLPAHAVLHRTAPQAPVGFTLGLTLADQAGLHALIAAQHDPRSPQFRSWLTPAAFGARFGVSAETYQAIARELTRAGLSVTLEPDRLIVHASGTAGQVEKLLGLTFHDVTAGTRRFRTFRGAPHFAAALAGRIQSVSGLDTRQRFKRRLHVPQLGNALGPQDLRRFYAMAPLHAQGFTGRLSKVGVVGPISVPDDSPDPADIDYFYSHVSNSSTALELVTLPNPNGTLDNQGNKGELELDAEMSTIAAPQEASVTLVLAPMEQFFTAGMAYMVNQRPDLTAVSVSYGNCESDERRFYASEMLTVANLIAQGAAEGQAWFAASGDNGVDDCGDGRRAAIDYPGSIPYMVSVGGTQYAGPFDANHAVTAWSQEVTWGDGSWYGAGGGGTSILFAKPSYQTGLGASGTFRDVPDFSLHAAPTPGVVLVDTAPGVLDASGGTSDAAPMAAGVFALLNDYLGGCRIGAPHFELYRLGRAQFGAGGAAVFHDILTGNLDQNGLVGPAAGPGFDDATGWGSLDVAALAAAWTPCPATGDPSGPVLLDDGGWVVNDAGLYDPGAFIPGAGEDGGARVPYDACAVLACDGGAICEAGDAGPSACVLGCDPAASPSTCPPSQYCDASTHACAPGCASDANCAPAQLCSPCERICMARGNDAGALGDLCSADAQCPSADHCHISDYFPGGTCTHVCDPSGSDLACTCPVGSVCQGDFGYCLRTCSVAAQDCPSGETCWNLRNGDQGACVVGCTLDSDCAFSDFTNVCNTATGVCEDPSHPSSGTGTSGSTGSTGSTASAGTSGSTGSTASAGTSGSTGSTASAGTSGSTSSSGGDSSSSSSGASSGSAASSSGSASSTSTGSSSTGSSSTGSTGSSSGDTSGSTGSTGSSSGDTSGSTGQARHVFQPPTTSGCGCTSGAGLEGPLGLLLAALGLVVRRRRAA